MVRFIALALTGGAGLFASVNLVLPFALVFIMETKKMLRYLLVIFSALLVLNVQADNLPPAFKAHYVVKKGPLTLGTAMRELRYGPDGELVFYTGSDSTGLAELLYSNHVRETTRLKQDGAHMVPLEYHYQRSGKRDRTIKQLFDWQQGSVTSHVDAAVYEYELPHSTIDLNAYQISLMVDLARGIREFSYPVAGKKAMRTYDIKYVGDERLNTVLGELNTVVMQRKTKRTTTMWCAPDLHFLPVKIQHEEKGSTFTAYLESVEGLPDPE